MREFNGTKIIIDKLILQETGSFHDLYIRPFEMDVGDEGDLRSSLLERISDSIGGRINQEAFHGISSSILAPRMDVDPRRDRIEIAGGFSERRARFMMKVDVETRMGQKDTYYFQGYTDHYGVSSSGYVAEDMIFEINGYIRVRSGYRETARGNEVVTRVIEMAQIVNGRVIYDEHCGDVMRLRPVDLFRDMTARNLDSSYTNGVTDTRTRFNGNTDVMFTRRSDSMPDRYLASAIGTFLHCKNDESFGHGDEQALTRAQQKINADLRNMEANPFLSQLANVQGVHKSAHFTIEDLKDIDRDLRVDVGRLSNTARTELATRDNCDDWKSPIMEAKWAVQIANAVSCVMMEHYHLRLAASFTNKTINTKIISDLHDATPVAEDIPVSTIEMIMTKLEDFLYDLSCRSSDIFDIHVRANLYDQTLIEIEINDGRMYRYYVPSFADSLMCASFTRNLDDLTSLSQDLQGILEGTHSESSGSRRELENAMSSSSSDSLSFG